MKHHIVNWCAVCNQGWILILLEEKNNRFRYKCEECEIEYAHYSEIDQKAMIKTDSTLRTPTVEELTRSGHFGETLKVIKGDFLINHNDQKVKKLNIELGVYEQLN